MTNLEDKFSQIYDQLVDRIYRFIYIKVSSEDVAKDLTSEVFLRFWNELNRGADIGNNNAFLYRVARNLVIDHYRDKARKQTIGTDDLVLADHREDIFEKAALSSDMLQIKAAISKLNPDYQDVIIWRYIDEQSIGEISQTLNKSEGAVRVMISRAMESLRQELSEKEAAFFGRTAEV